MIVYMVKFPNGKMYIGQTIHNLESRKKQHKKDYLKYDYVFYRAIRKYGWNNLIWEVIDTANTQEELNFKEQFWIKYYNTCTFNKNSNGYNSNIGGGSNSGFKHDKKAKDKMREQRKGERNANAKITQELAKEIKIRLANDEKTEDIINDYDINPRIIYNIKLLVAWKDLLPELNEKLKQNKNIRITEETAKEIKIKLANGEKARDISAELKIEGHIIHQISCFNSWKELLPELNNKIKNLKDLDKKIKIELAKQIKIKISQNEKLCDIKKDLDVSKNFIQNIKNLKTYKYVLPELNNRMKK